MKFSQKIYRTFEIKNFFKSNRLFFFFNGVNKNSDNWIKLTEQTLKSLNFTYYKSLNEITIKTLKDSTYNNVKSIINGSTFLIKPKFTNKNELILKNTLLNSFNILFFVLLAIKINNRIYSINSLKNLHLTNYSGNKLLYYQFNLINLKYYNHKLNK